MGVGMAWTTLRTVCVNRVFILADDPYMLIFAIRFTRMISRKDGLPAGTVRITGDNHGFAIMFAIMFTLLHTGYV